MKVIKKSVLILKFLIFYIRAMIYANLRVAYDVMTPGINMKPGFIALPLRAQSDLELLVFSNLINMTPGTLILEISPGRNFIFIHDMYISDLEKERYYIGHILQRRILELVQ